MLLKNNVIIMSIKLPTLSISQADSPIVKLSPGDIELVMSYYRDPRKGDLFCHNLNGGLSILGDISEWPEYHVVTDAHWSQLSYAIYNTTSLYWFLMMANYNLVNLPTLFSPVKAPNHIRYHPNVLDALRQIEEQSIVP
jgi:hypothetical protein